MIFFLIWAILVIRKGHLSWYSICSIYVAAVYITDYVDEVFDYWLNIYDLPAHLLHNSLADQYLGLVLSDGVIFPLIVIVFCYYSNRYHRPWLVSILFAPLMAIIEFILAKQGFMILHHWSHWITFTLTFVGFRILAHFADRFINYYPPVSYRFWLVSVIYTCYAWPGGTLYYGIAHLAHYRLHIFDNYNADDRFTELIIMFVPVYLVVYFAPRIRPPYKLFLFISLGMCWFIVALWMYGKGWLIYHHWNHVWTFIRYFVPCYFAYWIDRWESNYRSTLH
jgi:hypothetical protein